jgi:hypothetical protein
VRSIGLFVGLLIFALGFIGIVAPGVLLAHAIMTWWMAQGSVVGRLWAMLAVVFGGVIIHAVGSRRTT